LLPKDDSSTGEREEFVMVEDPQENLGADLRDMPRDALGSDRSRQ
jgi:hypothetical protein